MTSVRSIELKAKCKNPNKVRQILLKNDAEYRGRNHQIDTYFKTNNGRLKFRDGNVENRLVYYERKNISGPKQSNIILLERPDSNLIEMLNKSLNVLAVVDKQRDIYFINNVKFHVDEVQELGDFVEIEVLSYEDKTPREKLLEQCRYYMKLLGIKEEDLITESYSDLLLNKTKQS